MITLPVAHPRLTALHRATDVPTMSTRREFLHAGLALGVVGPASLRRPPRGFPLLPRVNGGINVQPLRRMDMVSDFTPPIVRPELVALQLRTVYELGFRSMRVTLSFNEFGPDFFAAIPYVRAARALGIRVVGIVDQFGFGYDLLRALTDPGRRRRVLAAYIDIFGTPIAPASRRRCPGPLALQILNEPTQARGLAPGDYVLQVLAPVYRDLRELAPELPVLSAAPVGRRAGLWRLREMLVHGVERVCDRVAVHVYDRDLIDDLVGLVRAPLEVTETGVPDTTRHVQWHQEVVAELQARVAGIEEVHWFDLFDFEPGVFRILDIHGTEGAVSSSVESHELYRLLAGRVDAATGRSRHATFDELIPDMSPYMPTGEDFARVEAAR